MRSEELKVVQRRRPFRPFTIHMADGSSVKVAHPELMLLTQGGDTIFVDVKGKEVAIIDVDLVTKITYPARRARKR